ncbi:unnamed protein product [Brassica rapa subsp. trilocularis]
MQANERVKMSILGEDWAAKLETFRLATPICMQVFRQDNSVTIYSITSLN